MKLSQLTVKNFRGIQELTFNLSNFTTLIGANNSGKSTLLRALEVFLSQEKLGQDDWPKGSTDPIQIEGVFVELSEWEKNVPGIAGIVQNGEIKLQVTHQSFGDKPTYKAYIEQEAISGWNEKFAELSSEIRDIADSLGINGTGFRQAANKERLKQEIRRLKPELVSRGEATWTAENISIDPALKQAIPQVITIPAVLDATDATKPQSTTTFGKLLSIIVLPAVQATTEFQNLKNAVECLSKKIRGDGVAAPETVKKLSDDISERIANIIKVKAIVDIAEPDTDKFLSSNAIIKLDDGVVTPISYQGHGAQRALIYALIEALAKKNAEKEIPTEEGEPAIQSRATILLFEEPELFLHPHLMRRLKESLTSISTLPDWQVVTSTHSPFLIDVANDPMSLVILRKDNARNIKAKQLDEDPFDAASKEALRATLDFHPSVCEAFFAARVILVEGDTEMAVLKHPDIDCERIGINKDIFNATTVVSCDGKWTIPAIAILMDKFNIPFRIIHDKDAKGRSDEALVSVLPIDPYSANEKITSSANGKPIYLVDDTFEHVVWPPADAAAPVPSKDKPFRAWKKVKEIFSSMDDIATTYPKLQEIYAFAYRE